MLLISCEGKFDEIILYDTTIVNYSRMGFLIKHL